MYPQELSMRLIAGIGKMNFAIFEVVPEERLSILAKF